MSAQIDTNLHKSSQGQAAAGAALSRLSNPLLNPELEQVAEGDGSINISEAAKHLNQVKGGNHGEHMTRESALELVAQIREKMNESSQQMMMAQAGKGNNGLLELLRSPA